MNDKSFYYCEKCDYILYDSLKCPFCNSGIYEHHIKYIGNEITLSNSKIQNIKEELNK